MLGWLSVAGGAILIVVTVMNQAMTKAPVQKAGAFTLRGEQLSDGIKQEAEVVQALGMTNAAFDRWQVARRLGLEQSLLARFS